jgi:hypothetical protein
MVTTIQALKNSLHWLEVVANTTANPEQRARALGRAAKLLKQIRTLEAFRESE